MTDERERKRLHWKQAAIIEGEPQGSITPAVEITEAEEDGKMRRSYTCGVIIDRTFRANLHLQHRFVQSYIDLLEQASAPPKRSR